MRRGSKHHKPLLPQELAAIFRPRDLRGFDLDEDRVRTWVRQGLVERVARGLYRNRSAEETERETLARVAHRVPGAVVCLLTALHVHEIGTQAPRHVWIAIDRKARKPILHGLPTRVVRFSAPLLRYGVIDLSVHGVRVRITSPARTVVDCFRYRNKIGLDVALEALRDAFRSRRVRMDDLVRAAEVCRVSEIMRPYLQAIAS